MHTRSSKLPAVHLLQIPTDQIEQTCTNTKSSFKTLQLMFTDYKVFAAALNPDVFDSDWMVSVVGW